MFITRNKKTGEVIYLAGCIGLSEDGQRLYQTQMFEGSSTCEILEESEISVEIVY